MVTTLSWNFIFYFSGNFEFSEESFFAAKPKLPTQTNHSFKGNILCALNGGKLPKPLALGIA